MGNTDVHKRVYDLLRQIPVGKISSYAALSKALNSSPRAVGGALKRNPYAPEVPCHRIICADGVSSVLQTIYFKNSRRTVQYILTILWKAIGGFKGEAKDAPSGINQKEKRRLLQSEGVLFDENGYLIQGDRWWDGFKL